MLNVAGARAAGYLYVMAISYPWEGPELCKGTSGKNNARCSNKEILGLEYCLHHVPDEDLEEAESITGWKRCRNRFGQPDACRQYAVNDTNPPLCKNHGANAGSERSAIAAQAGIEREAIERLEAVMRDDANAARIINPPPIEDPLVKLLEVAAEIDAMRIFFRDRVLQIKESEWRWRGREAEIIRAEIVLWERSQERLAQILIAVARIDVHKLMARISEARIQMMDRALTLALQASGADPSGQQRAREVLLRELAQPNLN